MFEILEVYSLSYSSKFELRITGISQLRVTPPLNINQFIVIRSERFSGQRRDFRRLRDADPLVNLGLIA